MKALYHILLAALVLGVAACERSSFSDSPSLRLNFSADTVLFDTVFTTVGSSTRYLKVYNRSKSDVRISSIRLAGGSTSAFRINVDGMSGTAFADIPLRSKDSLFVLVEVTASPTSQSSPLLIPDSLVFLTNGNVQDVKLVAWGQDVHLHKSKTVTADTVLTADKPHLIYGYLRVNPNAVLTIEAGATLHFHNLAQLVVKGTLQVNGEPRHPVVFEGDRLEKFYRDKAGQWSGVWLAEGSRNSAIRWAEIRNSIVGIMVDTCVTPGTPTLTLSHSRVENTSYAGLLARGARVDADNCLFANSAQFAVALTMGGAYRFYHCTVANYWNSYMFRNGPALLLNNYRQYQMQENGPYHVEPRDLTEASFYNSIIYGSMANEFFVDNRANGQTVNAQMSYYFQDCLLKVPPDFDLSDGTRFRNVLRLNPMFKSPYEHIYLLDTLSPAKDVAGIAVSSLYPLDLKNFNRLTDTKPDLGAFEREE